LAASIFAETGCEADDAASLVGIFADRHLCGYLSFAESSLWCELLELK